MESPLFRQLVNKVDEIASAARALLDADRNSEKTGIPGLAKWNGFDEDGFATVKIKDRVYVVNLITNSVPPLGAKVYVDEVFNVQYKNAKPKEEQKIVEPKKSEPKKSRRQKKRTKHPVFFDIGEIPSGAVWLVYPEILKRLEIKTSTGADTNPTGADYNLFQTLAAALILGGGAILGAILHASVEEKLEYFTVPLYVLPDPELHEGIPSGLSSDDFTKVLMFAGVLDSAQIGTPEWFNLDGLYAGIGGALEDEFASILINNVGGFGQVFSEIKLVNPARLSDQDIEALMYMYAIESYFSGAKIQAAIIRANAIYPGKRINVNVHCWPALPNRPIIPERIDESLPSTAVAQFRIPDDIAEWDKLSGAGGVDYTLHNGPYNFAYDLVPLHRLHDFLDDVPAIDYSKFASYDANSLYLNYVLITYAGWTGFGEDLRINYYSLNLKFSAVVDSNFTATIESEYSLNPGTFNLPPNLEIPGINYIAVENPEFPLQAGDRNQFTESITYTIEGTRDIPVVASEAFYFARRGENEIYGFVTLQGTDSSYIESFSGVTKYYPSRAPTFSVRSPLPGFLIHSRTGQFVFDQNVSSYSTIREGQASTFSVIVDIQPVGSALTLSQTIEFQVLGANSNYISSGSSIPATEEIELNTVDPAPVHSWDPDAYVEDDELVGSEAQVFEEVTTVVPFPEVKDDGSVFGWAGNSPDFTLEEVGDPVIKLNIDGQTIIADAAYIGPDDFEFSVSPNYNEDGGLTVESGFSVTFRPLDKNYNFLWEGESVNITYDISAKYANAPYVGYFEDLNAFQRKSLRAASIYYAFPDDWRYYIPNPRGEEDSNGYAGVPEANAPLRDEYILPFNISMTNGVVSTDYLHEFILKDYDPNAFLKDIENSKVYFTRRLRYEFDNETLQIVFYDKNAEEELDAGQESTPLSAEEADQIIRSSKSILKGQFFNADKMLPSGFNRYDTSGASWRKHQEHSKPVYSYIIFGLLPAGEDEQGQ